MIECKNKFNYGLALLRMFMCFEVVLCHCWLTAVPIYLKPFSVLKAYAVPVFMFMSFFFTQKNFKEDNSEYIIKRISKLILPQVVWAVIYFITYWIIGKLIRQKIVEGADLFWQILTGHSSVLNATMWFQTEIIIITCLFFGIFHFFGGGQLGITLITLISVFCLFLQYSGINMKIFGTMRYELAYPLGRISETIPMATIGFIAARFKLLEPTSKRKINVFIGSVLTIIFVMLDRHVWIMGETQSFGYSGIWKLGVAYAITMFAFNIRFEWCGEKICSLIQNITKYTLGIYCGHRLVAFFVVNGLSIVCGLTKYEFYQCVIIYGICYLGGAIINKLPLKWCHQIV